MANTPSSPPRVRLESIDVLRGLVIVIMALDHSRDFFSNSHAYFDPIDVTQTSAAFFLTRWVTDFCAPIFSFLAGLGVWLYASHGRPKAEVARMLVTRGLWLILLELTVVRVAWYFNFDFTLLKAGVLWALGWSMIALAGIIHLPLRLIIVLSVGMIVGHNLLDGLQPAEFGAFAPLWSVLHQPGTLPLVGDLRLLVVYPLIPWIGIMAAGYAFGPVFNWDQSVRRRWVFRLGLGLTIAFVVVRGFDGYGDPQPWTFQPHPGYTFLSFLACTKYPPSLTYLLMTLGPAFMLFAALDRPSLPGMIRPIAVYGRVPFLFYVLHLPLLHGMAVAWATWYWGSASWLLANPPGGHWPHDFHFDLTLTYSAWLICVLVLYPVCRWFGEIKSRRRDWWLSYL